MGIGHITEARETAGGTVRDGGTSAKVATGGGFDPLRANVDPFKARSIQIESLRPIAEAMRKHELATTAIEKASATKADIDEIRNGLPEGEHAGMWKDDAGVWRPALNNEEMIRRKFETENTMGVSFEEYRKGIFDLAKNAIKRRKDQRLAGETNDVRAFVNRETGEDIVAFEGDCEEALLVGRIGENFARANASVAGDAGAMNNTALGRIGSDNAQLKTLKAVGGDEFDAGAAARERTDLWARQYVRQSLEGRAKAAVVLASQSGGLMSPAAATRRANEIYDGQARELMRQLVEAGEYERARMFVGHAEELGYSGAVKAKALGEIDAAEDASNKKAFNGVQATAQSAVAMGRLKDAIDPQTGATLPGMEDVLEGIRNTKSAYEPGTELRAAYDKLEAQVDRQADRQTEFEMWSKFPAILGKDYGRRNDGTAKGRGFLGELKLPDGRIATEYSIGVEIDGKETEIPTLVPTLTEAERKKMVEDIIPNGKKVPKAIEEKAVKHAKDRMKAGRSPFADAVDSNPYPEGTRQHRLYPALAQEFERQMGAIIDAETKARQADRSGRLKEEMVAAVSTAPGAFMAKLAEESKNGGISVAQFNEIADDARKLYANTAAAERARTMLDIFQRTFSRIPTWA